MGEETTTTTKIEGDQGGAKCCGISVMPALLGGKATELRDLPEGPVAKNLCFQCRGPGVPSLGRELEPMCQK